MKSKKASTESTDRIVWRSSVYETKCKEKWDLGKPANSTSVITSKGFSKGGHIMSLCVKTAFFSQEVTKNKTNDNGYLRTQTI